jgi:hypothetical protein
MYAPSLSTLTRSLIIRIIAALALCALGIIGTAAAFRFALNPIVRPERDTGMHREKLTALRALAPEIDVLVVGSSRLLHGFDPRLFDAEAARLSQPLRSFNLSLQRLLLWEQVRVLDDALAIPGLKPRIILIEPSVGLGIAPENFTHARTLEFETPAAWYLAVSAIVGSNRSVAHKAWNIATHCLVALLHAVHYGLYTSVVFPPVPAKSTVPTLSTPSLHGYIPLPDRPSDDPALSGLADLQAHYLANFAAHSANPGSLPAALHRHFLALRDRLGQRGVEVLFVQPPQLDFTTPELRELTFQFAPAIAPENGRPGDLSYLDPNAHLELFAPRWWLDYNHYTTTGASLFTRRLAADVIRVGRISVR